jgi:hypothetical protein
MSLDLEILKLIKSEGYKINEAVRDAVVDMVEIIEEENEGMEEGEEGEEAEDGD